MGHLAQVYNLQNYDNITSCPSFRNAFNEGISTQEMINSSTSLLSLLKFYFKHNEVSNTYF